jgi:SAM-dependent methyltransferase
VTADQPDTRLIHDVGYFEDMYAGAVDPWGFDSRFYEQRKFALTCAALPRRHYRRGLEPGCSNGALTRRLAPRCDALVAFDFIADTVERARERLRRFDHVEVVQATFPDYWPPGTGDLVVLSEVAYYLTPAGLRTAAERLSEWLEPEGSLVAVHYTAATNYPQRGDQIGPWLDSLQFLQRLTTHHDPLFDLGVWERRPSR